MNERNGLIENVEELLSSVRKAKTRLSCMHAMHIIPTYAS